MSQLALGVLIRAPHTALRVVSVSGTACSTSVAELRLPLPAARCTWAGGAAWLPVPDGARLPAWMKIGWLLVAGGEAD